MPRQMLRHHSSPLSLIVYTAPTQDVKPDTHFFTDPNPKIPFGKHKGMTIKNVPAAYLRWLAGLPDLSDDLRGPVLALLAQYAGMKGGAK